MKKLHRIFIICFASLFFSGCVSNKSVTLPEEFWKNKKQKLTVVIDKPVQPKLHQVGSQGLLEYAVTSAMNGKMKKSVNQSDLSWYKKLPFKFQNELNNREIKAKVYISEKDLRKSDYAEIAANNQSEELLIIRLETFGAKRNYQSLIPTHPPEGYCVLSGELVRLSDKKVVWRYRTEVAKPIIGDWDEPTYTKLHLAIQEAQVEASEELLASFFSGH